MHTLYLPLNKDSIESMSKQVAEEAVSGNKLYIHVCILWKTTPTSGTMQMTQAFIIRHRNIIKQHWRLFVETTNRVYIFLKDLNALFIKKSFSPIVSHFYWGRGRIVINCIQTICYSKVSNISKQMSHYFISKCHIISLAKIFYGW